jgi:hypothetical protein
MNSQKSLPVELQFHRTFSRKISINRSSTSGQTEGSTGRHSTLHLRRKQVEGSTLLANPEPDWRIPYLDHLTRGDLPSDKIEA